MFLEALPDVKKLTLAGVEVTPLSTSPDPSQDPSGEASDSEMGKYGGILDRILCIQLEGDVLEHDYALKSLAQFRNIRTLRLAYYPRFPPFDSPFKQSSSMLNPLENRAADSDISSLPAEPEFEAHPPHPPDRPEAKLTSWLKKASTHRILRPTSSEGKDKRDQSEVGRRFRHWPHLQRFELEGINMPDSSFSSLIRCLQARGGSSDDEDKTEVKINPGTSRMPSPPAALLASPDEFTSEASSLEQESIGAGQSNFSLSLHNCSLSRFFVPAKRTVIPDFVSTSARDARKILEYSLAKLK